MGQWLLRPTVKILAILIYGLPLTKKPAFQMFLRL